MTEWQPHVWFVRQGLSDYGSDAKDVLEKNCKQTMNCFNTNLFLPKKRFSVSIQNNQNSPLPVPVPDMLKKTYFHKHHVHRNTYM